MIRLQVVASPSARDQIAFYAFHSFLVEVQINTSVCTHFSCIKATWRLGLWAVLETHNYAGKFAFNFNKRRGFSPGTLVFPSPQKPTFPNSNLTRNQVDEEPLCGCATSKSLFILFIYLCLSKKETLKH